MRLLSIFALVSFLAFALRAEEPASQPEAEARAVPKLKAPSNLKFNSTTGTTKVFAPAPAGQALIADGTGFKSLWAFVKGTDIDSGAASSGMVTMAPLALRAGHFQRLSVAPQALLAAVPALVLQTTLVATARVATQL